MEFRPELKSGGVIVIVMVYPADTKPAAKKKADAKITVQKDLECMPIIIPGDNKCLLGGFFCYDALVCEHRPENIKPRDDLIDFERQFRSHLNIKVGHKRRRGEHKPVF